MRARSLAAVAVVLSLAAPAAADAKAPTKPCRLIEDPAGDATGVRLVDDPVPLGDIDLVLGDVMYSRSHLIVLMRVVDLSGDDAGSWRIHVVLDGARHDGEAKREPDVETSFVMVPPKGPALKGVTGVFDDVRDEVRFMVPLSSFGKQAPRKGRTAVAIDWMGAEMIVPDRHPARGTVLFKDQAWSSYRHACVR